LAGTRQSHTIHASDREKADAAGKRRRPLTLPANRTAFVPPNAAGDDTRSPSLISLLAHGTRSIQILPHLHEHAVKATGGACSLLFEYNPRDGALQATSGFGLEALPTERWLPGTTTAPLLSAAFRGLEPMLVGNLSHHAPDVATRLGTASALLVPLVRRTEWVGLLAIGFREAPASVAPVRERAIEIGDAFLTALELFRFRENEQVQRDVMELVQDFSQALAATLSLTDALDLFCTRTKVLFGADRASVWLHDRRARDIVLRASSDLEQVTRRIVVSTEDPEAPAALAMRRARAEILASSDSDTATATITVPMRGTRRALGTLLFEGVRAETGSELALLDLADRIGRSLSAAVENMQLLEDLTQSRRELENTFDSIADLVAVSDRHGRIVQVNRAFAARVAALRADVVDRPLADHVGDELGQWLADRLSDSGREHERTPGTREIVDPVLRGTFIVTLTDLLDHGRERVGIVMVARDQTRQTRLEAEREELRKRLAQSEKLAALGQFVAGIAHELNNPLQGVLGHLELMRATGAFPRQLRKEVQMVYREADRAAKIVRNLLVFAGSRQMKRRTVSLNVVLQRALALRAAACRAAGIEVVRHYDEKLPRVLSDPLLLHQVFANVVMNAEQAVAASSESGRIEVTTSTNETRDRVIATIRDTGPGIQPDVLSRIFEPFYTTKDVGKGTGLGLAIAYGIVQEHGGQIIAANHPEGGAVFSVELPAAAKVPGRP
jgi:two-component system, NtrC family, sensor kinase